MTANQTTLTEVPAQELAAVEGGADLARNFGGNIQIAPGMKLDLLRFQRELREIERFGFRVNDLKG
jgi:hypothetical protein